MNFTEIYTEPNYHIYINDNSVLLIIDFSLGIAIKYLYFCWTGDINKIKSKIGSVAEYDNIYFISCNINSYTEDQLEYFLIHLNASGKIISDWTTCKAKKSIWFLKESEKKNMAEKANRIKLINQKIDRFPPDVKTRLFGELRQFYLSMGPKTLTHQHYHTNCDSGYIIDSKSGKTLKLVKGQKYKLVGSDEHLNNFYILINNEKYYPGSIIDTYELINRLGYASVLTNSTPITFEYGHRNIERAGGKIELY